MLGAPASHYRLLVFDWDGTLMDSTESIVAATLAALAELGVAGPEAEDIRQCIGLSPRESFDRLFPEASAEDEGRIRERIRHHWLTRYQYEGRILAGAVAALAKLEAAGYFLAVATGKGRAGLDHDLRKTGLAERFLASRTADEAASKPHPEMLLGLMDELGARPRDTLMIGDTTFDLEMANNAGCAAVGVLTGSHDQAQLDSCEPLTVLDSVAALPRWLGERG